MRKKEDGMKAKDERGYIRPWRYRRTQRLLYISWVIIWALWLALVVVLAADTNARNRTEEQTGRAEPAGETEIVIAAPASSTEPVYPLTDEEQDLITAVCWSEARGEGLKGMKAVAEVVFNRLLDGRFGGSVAEVCTPDQFHGLRQVSNEPVTQEAHEAVMSIFEQGEDAGTNGALFFCTAATDPADIKAGLMVTARIGNHVFYRD